MVEPSDDTRSKRENQLYEDIFQKMIDSLPPFDGTDSNTKDHWVCKSCYMAEGEEGVHLQLCSRCKIVMYCSIECQRKDFKEHKKECKEIAENRTNLRREEQRLRHVQLWAPQPENAFETIPGKFWLEIETRDYCRARYLLSNNIEHLAHWYEVLAVLDEARKHRLELLRLCYLDNIGIRFRIPFTLLRMNRDDECFAFIKHWTNRSEEEGDFHPNVIEQLHGNSSPGAWLYGTADKFEDLLETVPNITEDSIGIAHYAALCIIKLRLVETHNARKKQAAILADTKAGQAIGDSMEHVQMRIIGDQEEQDKYRRQEEMVNKYFDIMDRQNPTLLKAVINPGPLKRQPAPQYISLGTASEAWEILMDCNRLFVRIPGVEDRLRERFGPNPSYDCDMGFY